MGNTRNTGRAPGGAHAVEGGITHGPADAVHRRSPARRAVDHRAVRALRRLPEDRLQVDRPLPSPRAGRPGGSLATPAALAESDPRGDRERDPRRPAATPALGRQEAPGAAAQAASPVEPAGALDGLRHSEPPRDGASATPPSSPGPSGEADEPGPRAE